MKRVAFIYPGQGSQSVGMGKDLADEYPLVKALFDHADEILAKPLTTLMFEGPDEQLTKTVNAQPALLLVSSAITHLLKKEGITPATVAGHSLGEYSALVSAGVIKIDEALPLVRKRGELMEEAFPEETGAMAAVLGLEQAILSEQLKQIARESNETIEIANLNCPGQVVISGTKKALQIAETVLKEEGAKRFIVLNVSGPFHSTLMKPAANVFAKELEKVEMSSPEVPIYANVTAEQVEDEAEIKSLLIKQLYSTVRFQEILENLINANYDAIVEIGSGKVLTGLVKKINRRTKTFSLQDSKSVKHFIDWYKGED